MSLQGSLDTFALPDVLVLLATTHKSGELHIAGSRGVALARHPDTEGRLWFDAGGLVGHDVGRAVEPADAVFELLRLNQGTFSFLAGTPSGGGPRVEVDGILSEAQARLVEWREIEAVVPSLDAWLQLSPEPPLAHVSMRGEQWRLVVAIGAGCTVGTSLGHLGLEELPGCRAVKELIEAGLVLLTVQPAPAALPTFWNEPEPAPAAEALPTDPEIVYHRSDEPADEPAFHFSTADEAPWATDEPDPAGWAAAATLDDTSVAPFDPAPFDPAPYDPAPSYEPVSAYDPAPVYDAGARVPAATGGPQDWRAELGDLPDLDAIANMAPKRRRVEAEDATVPPAPALDESEEGEEPLNRGLLLKFLSSVRN